MRTKETVTKTQENKKIKHKSKEMKIKTKPNVTIWESNQLYFKIILIILLKISFLRSVIKFSQKCIDCSAPMFELLNAIFHLINK